MVEITVKAQTSEGRTLHLQDRRWSETNDVESTKFVMFSKAMRRVQEVGIPRYCDVVSVTFQVEDTHVGKRENETADGEENRQPAGT